jgi:hypothetical protein
LRTALSRALFFFSIGAEQGQVAFIIVVLVSIILVWRVPLRKARWAELIPPYAIGLIAMLWVVQRVATFLGVLAGTKGCLSTT